MNTENVQLARTVLGELAQRPDILKHTNIDAHVEYMQTEPNLEGNYLDMGGWYTASHCGTAACLAGWLADDPRIQARGLILIEAGNGQHMPVYGGHTGIEALHAFLGWHYMASTEHVFASHWRNSFAQGLGRFDSSAAQEREWLERQSG